MSQRSWHPGRSATLPSILASAWLSAGAAWLLGFLIVLVTLPAVSWAQAAALSGTELRSLTRAGQEAPPQLEIRGEIERSPCPLADPRFSGMTLTIETVEFSGLGEIPSEVLAPAWHHLAGEPAPVAALCEIRDRAATILRSLGFIAGVEVPVQRIEQGRVRLQVILGRITSLRARGETAGAETKLAAYLSRLAGEGPFNRLLFERYLLLAKDLPGYQVQLVLKPAGKTPGDLVADLVVMRQPVVAELTVQNLSAGTTGRWGGQARIHAHGLTGLGDRTTLSYFSTSDFREQHIVQLAHEFRPGGQGLVVGGQVTRAWTRPAAGGGPSIEADTLFASLHARYPLALRQARSLWLTGGIDIVDQDVSFLGPLTRDRLRVGWLRASLDAIDTASKAPRWRLASSLELRQGIDGLGALSPCRSPACGPQTLGPSRLDGSPTATVLRAEADAELAMGRMVVALSPRAQYAMAPVLGFEEFAGGNYTIGRGYDPGSLLGDHGLGLAGEVRLPALLAGRSRQHRLQPFVFADAAWAWERDGNDPESILSAGLGMRAHLARRYRLETVLALPVKRASLQSRRGDVRFLVSLTTLFSNAGSRR